MVRRSKRGAKSESTDEGDAQDEQVTEQLCTVEHSGEGEVHSDANERSILKDVEVTCEPHSLGDQVVGDTEDVQVNQSETETGEMEIGGGCVTSELNNPKASQSKEEVMDLGDDAVAAALAEAETALACESETPLEKESAALAVKAAADQPASEKMAAEAVTESDEKEAEQESDEKDAEQEQCLYCDHRGFSVSDVDAYAAHLETEHRVVRNAHLLARITIDTHRQGMTMSAG